jgi:hypothetical protein
LKWLIPILVAVAFLLFADPFLSPPDCASYWAWGESLVRDGDLAFSNQYAAAEMPTLYVYLTPTGRIANDWPMGAGFALLPWMLLGRVAAQAWIFALVLGAMKLAADTIAETPRARTVALGAMFAGTPLLFYTFCGPFFSHAVSFAVTTAFLVMWARTRDNRSPEAWLALGLLLGIAALVRPQNLLLGIVFLAEWRTLLRAANRGGIVRCALGAVLGFAPAMIVYRTLYGSFLALPKAEEMNWFSPAVIEVLFSDFHGILPWTPIYVLGIAGLIVLAKRDGVLGRGLLAVFAVQLYLNAANLVWWSGGSFGNRRMADSAILVAWGIGALWAAASTRRQRIALTATASLCVAWTCCLVLAERRLLVPLDRYIPFLDSEFPGRLIAVATSPIETFRACARPFISALEPNGGMLARGLSALALGGVTALLMRLRPPQGRARIAALGLGTASLILTCAVLVAAARTPPLDPATLPANMRATSGILWDNYVELAYYELVRGDFAEAETAARRAIDVRDNHPTAWWYLAVATLEQGRPAQAAEAAQRVLEMNPDHAGARRMLGLDR